MAASKTLFWKYGMRKVSVEEICKEAGISKMTFYRMFKNKNELIYELLSAIYTKGFEDYKNLMAEEISFPEKVKKILLLKHEGTQDVSREFITEVYKSDDASLQKLLADYQEKTTKELRKDFIEAQKQGWIHKDLKMDSIFYLLNLIQEKLFDPVYIALHSNIQEAIMEMTNFFFYGIMSPENQKK